MRFTSGRLTGRLKYLGVTSKFLQGYKNKLDPQGFRDESDTEVSFRKRIHNATSYRSVREDHRIRTPPVALRDLQNISHSPFRVL